MEATELRIGNYDVTCDGRVFNLKTSRFLKPRINDKGYPCVSLHINGRAKFVRIHRLVATKFIPNPQNKPCVNHKDRNRSNPKADNLEWCTHSENVIHSIKHGGRKNYTRNNTGEKNANCKLSFKIISAIRDLYDSGDYSQNDISEIFNINQGRISKIINRKIWKSQN